MEGMGGTGCLEGMECIESSKVTVEVMVEVMVEDMVKDLVEDRVDDLVKDLVQDRVEDRVEDTVGDTVDGMVVMTESKRERDMENTVADKDYGNTNKY